MNPAPSPRTSRTPRVRLHAAYGRWRELLRLQIGDRWVLFLVADSVLLVAGVFNALLGEGDAASLAYLTVVVAPALLLGVPALADLVALERDAGSLDLLLCAPDAAAHLRARGLAVTGLMLGQAWLVLLITWAAAGFSFAVLPALAHSAAIFALVGAAALFWATRLESAGAVGLATFATALALGRWLLEPPIAPRTATGGNAWLPGNEFLLTTAGGVLVLAAVAGGLWLGARRRLARTALLLR
jgi:hypothetical protein